MVDEQLLFLRPDNKDTEVLAEEYLFALGQLEWIQSQPGHSKCPNTKNPPKPCDYCKKHLGDEYRVWRMLMVLNAPVM
jgi:hypothetical protein